MATCLCDAFFDDVARATVEVLEHLECIIEFPENQTCCGQPAFNSGDWPASRKVIRHVMNTFEGNKPVVIPSGSCAAMLFHGAPLEFQGEQDAGAVDGFAKRVWELSDFIVNGLGVKTWPGRLDKRVAFHRSCHSRGTQSGIATMQLLSSIEGLTVEPFGEAEQCCGFGGTFSVTFPHVSASMGRLKLDNVLAQKPDYLISGDMSCMMHLGGLAEKEGRPVQTRHIAQILRDSLIGAPV
jgi:L-lactate dehydrogenase complex protein LldE